MMAPLRTSTILRIAGALALAGPIFLSGCGSSPRDVHYRNRSIVHVARPGAVERPSTLTALARANDTDLPSR